MKKFILVLIIILMIFQRSSALAETDGYYPKLIVTDYTVENETLIPGDTAKITIQIKNTHSTKYARNIKLSFEDSTNEILPVKTASIICPIINKGEIFEWEVEVYIIESVKDAPHVITITAEYENSRGFNLLSKDTILIDVIQPVRLEYNEPKLPVRVTEGDAFAFEMNLMNMGKGDIYNALLSFNIDGIANGGSVLVGNLTSGEQKTGKTNFRVNKGVLGDVTGHITLTYEDNRGRLHEEVIEVSTMIQEKIIAVPDEYNQSENEEDEFPWKNLSIALIVLSALLLSGCIVFVTKEKKLRKDYESKL